MTRQERDVPAFPFEFGPYGSSTRAYDILRRSSPLRRVSLPSGQQAWLVTTYADVCSVHREPMFSRAEAVRTAATLVKSAGMKVSQMFFRTRMGNSMRGSDGCLEYTMVMNTFPAGLTPFIPKPIV